MYVIENIRKLGAFGAEVARRVAFMGPLLARFTAGVAFAESGWGKVHNLDAVAAFFAELGIPAPQLQATFVSWVELVCGSLVLLGLGTRLAALPLICTMIVALLTAKAEDIAGISDLVGSIEFTYAALLSWLAVSGAGALSLDRLITRRAPEALAAPGLALPGSSLRA